MCHQCSYKNGNTWNTERQKITGDCKRTNTGHYPNNPIARRKNYHMTCKINRERRYLAGNSSGNLHLTTTRGRGNCIDVTCYWYKPKHSIESSQNHCVKGNMLMAREGSCNTSTNRDLKVAKEMYET